MTELVPTNWNIQGIESMADWVNKLAIISSSIIANHWRTLLEYNVRLTVLTQPYSKPLPTTTPSCKSSRFRQKKDAVEASAPRGAQLKEGETYINVIKVCLLFCFIFLAAESWHSATAALLVTRYANKQLVQCAVWGVQRRGKNASTFCWWPVLECLR